MRESAIASNAESAGRYGNATNSEHDRRSFVKERASHVNMKAQYRLTRLETQTTTLHATSSENAISREGTQLFSKKKKNSIHSDKCVCKQ